MNGRHEVIDLASTAKPYNAVQAQEGAHGEGRARPLQAVR